MKTENFWKSLAWLLLGAGLYTFVTWKWNVALAAWLAPVFLIRYFRTRPGWLATLPAVALLWGASYANKTGAWGMDPLVEVALLGIAALPLVVALYLDRFTSSRLPGLFQTLVFPAAYVALDYAISFFPLGTSLSLAPSQFYFRPLVQAAALTGAWGIEFLALWAGPVANTLWEAGFELRPAGKVVAVYGLVLAAALLYGGLRLVVERPAAPNVRVAGVTIAHARNYWDEIIDRGTPPELARSFLPEFQALEEQLFAASEKAARSGAKVIFWSEADAFILPEQKDAFLQRARAFARQQGVYFMPAYEILRYGDTSGYNGLAMITPQGEIAYEYEKTMSWYATNSDGVLHSVGTPYGRIGALICFDLDFPALARQAAQQGVDILLVPAFDTYATRVYHTEVGLLRAVEDGFAVARMVNEGTSMAADARGQVLAVQDFFTTAERIMFADLPTRGVSTPYGLLGDWFAWLSILLVFGAVSGAVLRRAPKTV